MAKKKVAKPKMEMEEEIEVAEEDEIVEEPPATDADTALSLIQKKADSEAAWLEKKFPDGGGGPAADRLRDLIGFLRAQSAPEG